MHRYLALFVTLALTLAISSSVALAQPAPEKLATIMSSKWVTATDIAPDDDLFAVGTYEGVKIWSRSQKKNIGSVKVKGYARAVEFSHDGSLLAVGSYQMITLWDTEKWNLVREIKGHRAYVMGVSFSSDDKWLASASEDETAKIWNVKDGALKLTLDDHNYPVNGIAFSPDDKMVATASGDDTRVTRPGEIYTWDVETGELVHEFAKHTMSATGVAFSADGEYLVSTSLDETVYIHWAKTGKAFGYNKEHQRPTNTALFSPDGFTVISAAGGRAKGKNWVKIWNRMDGDEWTQLEHKERITSIALTSDGRTLLTGSYDDTAVVWDIGPVLDFAADNRDEKGHSTKPEEEERPKAGGARQ